MARSLVLAPFGWSPNGNDHEDLAVGDERDFGSNTDGLKGLGWICDVVAAAVAEPAIEPVVSVEATAVQPEVETPASEAPVAVLEPVTAEPEVTTEVAEPVVVPTPAPTKRRSR